MGITRSPLTFFVLVFILSIPFWVMGAFMEVQLLPALPVSALAVVCPAAAAFMLVYRENGSAGVKALLKRALDYKKIRVLWYAPILLLIPGATGLSYALMRMMGMPLPPPQFLFVPALAMFVMFFFGAIGEELGWSGYATDPMQERWGALQASLVLGLVWAAWHVIPLIQAHRSFAWIAWWSFDAVALRVLVVWLYNNTSKSVFAAILFHAVRNLTWQFFPEYGSHWDPRIVGPITAFAAAIVTIVWGPRTLARFRTAA